MAETIVPHTLTDVDSRYFHSAAVAGTLRIVVPVTKNGALNKVRLGKVLANGEVIIIGDFMMTDADLNTLKARNATTAQNPVDNVAHG